MEKIIHDFGDFGTLTKITVNTTKKNNETSANEEVDLTTQRELNGQPEANDLAGENV